MTWKNHLYGDKDNKGIPQLNQRIGMLKRLSKFMSKTRLKYFSEGIFYSKLNYCLPVFGNVFGLDNYKEVNRRYYSFTVKDNNNLQVLQNKLNRLLLDADYNTSTQELLNRTDTLSIHQMIAYQTAVNTYKIIKSGKPTYVAMKMKGRQLSMATRQSASTVTVPGYKLNLAREGFIFRGATLFNKLDVNIRTEPKLSKFKLEVKKWVKRNIPIKPKQTFQSIATGQPPPPPPPPEPPPPQGPPTPQRTILDYFTPVQRANS